MDVVDATKLPVFDDDHPTRALRQRYLFEGQDGTPENYMFSIAETIGHFTMSRHRHNFDQFRFSLSGGMSVDPDRRLKEGHLAYFPEGSSYGPQDDGPGPIALVLQFGGASGNGYMSMGQYRTGREALNKKGRFDGAVFIRDEGLPTQRKKFSINAIWEEAMGKPMLIPTSRYDRPFFMNPGAYRWVPQEEPGTYRKALGSFSEKETIAEIWRVDAGATLNIPAENSIRLMLVLEGEGTADDETIGKDFGLRLQPGESGTITASKRLEILGFRLPVMQGGWSEPDEPSFEPVPEESVSREPTA